VGASVETVLKRWEEMAGVAGPEDGRECVTAPVGLADAGAYWSPAGEVRSLTYGALVPGQPKRPGTNGSTPLSSPV